MDYLISKKLRELRKNRNITQEKLAEILDISRSKVSSWETNKRDMTITDAVNIANYYEISLDNLLRVNPMKEKEYIEISYSFFKNKSISLKEEASLSSEFFKGTDGEYKAHLIAREKHVTLLDLTISVPTETIAQSICEKWERKSQDVYQFLIEQLF